jgi:hypothetical protein
VNFPQDLAVNVFMRIATSFMFLMFSLHANAGILVGSWEYDSDRIISELKANSAAPAKVLRCFELRACGHNATFVYTARGWMQRSYIGNNEHIDSEYTDYHIITETLKEIVFRTRIEGVETEFIYSIISNDLLSYTVESEGFSWVEYLRRKH